MNSPISRFLPLPLNRESKLAKDLAVTATVMFLASAAHAATASFSTDPPATGSLIISNLTGAYTAGTANAALNSNVDDPRYIADNQPAQGQTFKTGTTPLDMNLRP